MLADYHRFKQVLINLLSNAVKYNRDGGRITVSCRPVDDGRVRVAVTDTGDGIPPEMIDRVFVPFDRLDASARGVEGTGIGLSLSKTFVEAMDGTIGVESTVGVGSTFWVELPAGPRRPGRSGGRRRPAGAPGDTRAQVLVIEDDAAVMHLIATVLRRHGFEVALAGTGRAGLHHIDEHHPGVVVLDVGLPDLDGWQVLQRIREISAVPVLMLTGHADEPDKVRGLRAGADDYLTKPFGIDEFTARVEALLRRGHSPAHAHCGRVRRRRPPRGF